MPQQVILFTAAGCESCKQARKYLSERGVDFQEKDITQDAAAQQKLAQMGLKATPVIVVGDKAIAGFDAKTVEEMLLHAA